MKFLSDSHLDSKTPARLLQVCLAIAAVTLVLYGPVQSFDFVFDDGLYITTNRHVQSGFTSEELGWAFSTFHGGNWHPLTWVSHIIDFEAYRLDAGGHHWTNVLIHTANSILLLLVLFAMTQSLWASALVAVLFAIHPLHVESVAWVSERKDVLSAFFWILTLGAYTFYARQPAMGRYLLVLFLFGLGLLSKPMVVTLPFALLLLDYWPLERFSGARTVLDRWILPRGSSAGSRALRLGAEKLPLLFMAAGLSVATILAQGSVDAIWSIKKIPFDVRVANALVSYLEYIRKMILPVDLAVLYPHAGFPPAWKIVTALLFLVSVSVICVRRVRTSPHLIVGWLWYVGTLVPVIGLVQVGSQSMADRYTYIPLVGLYVASAWEMKSLVERRPAWKLATAIVVLVTLSGLLLLTRSQVETWRNGVTLFERALHVTGVNPMAQYNLGAYYLDRGDCRQAVPHLLKALEMKREFSQAFHGLGVCAAGEGNWDGALYYYQRSIETNPRFTKPRIDRGLVFMQQQRLAAAAQDFEQALQVEPHNEAAHTNLGMLCVQQGRWLDAEAHLREALRFNDDQAEAHNNLGIVILQLGKPDEAALHFRQALKLAPENPAIRRNAEHVLNAAAN